MRLRDIFDPPVPAIVLAEGGLGAIAGKTANGLLMHGEIFDVEVVVDSTKSVRTTADVLDAEQVSDVPIVDSVEEALDYAQDAEAIVVGVATPGGVLPEGWVPQLEFAIKAGCDVVSGMHIFLGDDERWRSLSEEHGVRLIDVRKPPSVENMQLADGAVDETSSTIVLVMGTDCAVGKRTTTFELYRAAKRSGANPGWVATGQTGIMIGAHEGTVIDRVPSDFAAGVVEGMVQTVAQENELVFVEGQAALMHRAYSGVTLSILHGAWPDAVVLVDDPTRDRRTHFEQFPVASIGKEIELIESLADTEVVALSTWGNPTNLESEYGLPTANVYRDKGSDELYDVVMEGL